MQDFNLQPAADHGLSSRERFRSVRRETGLVGACVRRAWWAAMRVYLALYHRFTVEGEEHLPAAPPYVLIGNHASHLDAIMLAARLPTRLRDRVFPVAAGDVFFEKPLRAAFAALCVNGLPIWRHRAGRHALDELARRLVDEPCIFVLFPEGRRSQDGSLLEFREGLGMLVAGKPVPVVPCYLDGASRALPRLAWVPRPVKVRLRIGAALRFDEIENRRAGWSEIAARCRAAVVDLSKGALS
jgi:1-acyl-sn-glycerol-3-phosphate acyltransferase